jgi:hypothetical protein
MVVLLDLVCSVFARIKAGRPQRTQFKIGFKNAKMGSTAKAGTGKQLTAVVKDEKKPPDSLAVFREFSVSYVH